MKVKLNYKLTGIQNQFSYIRRTGKRQLNLNSSVTYSTMPENRLTFTGVQGISTQFYQMGNGQTFSTSNGTSFGYDISRMSKLSVGVSLRADYDKVFTLLQRNDTATLNRNDGFKITTSISPEYRLLAVDERYGVTIGVPTSSYSINYRDRINPSANVWINRPYFSPWLTSHYILSPFSKLLLNAGLNTNIGDITDFIVNPIQASYNQKNTRSGILAITRSYSSNLGLEFKNPLKLFFANASVDYGNSERNILINQSITNGLSNVDINSSGIADKNNAQNISVSGDVSKDVRAISTFFSLGASYGISSSVQLRQGVKRNVYGNSFSVSPTIRSTLIKKLEMNYWMNYGQSWQHSVNFKSVFHSQSHNMTINYNPIEAIIVYGSVEYNRFEIMPKQFKNMQFFNAGVRYKYKKLEAELKLNNLLNTKVYTYTVLDQMDRFTYTYHLNPREVVAICKFTL